MCSGGCIVDGNRSEERTWRLLRNSIGVEWPARLGAEDLRPIRRHDVSGPASFTAATSAPRLQHSRLNVNGAAPYAHNILMIAGICLFLKTFAMSL